MADEPYPWEVTHLVAASTGDVAKLQQELDQGADVNYSDHEYGRTPLLWAAEKGHEDVVQLLITYGADINFIEPDLGKTALLAATTNDHEAVARQLIEACARVNTRDASCETPLIVAAKDGRISLVKLLLNAGADIDAKGWHYGQTALSLAAANGHTDIVDLLLQNNAVTDIVDDTGRKALAWAIEEGHDDIVEILANQEADPGSTGAAEEGLTSETLFSAYPDVSGGSDEDRLEWAFETGHISVVEELLEQGVDPEHKDKTGRTPLILAASEGHIELVKLLLEKNVEVDSKDEEGRTPLSYAKLLFEHGAQPFSEAYWDNVPPLEVVVSNGLDEMVALFLKVEPVSSKAKQEHVRKAICQAVEMDRENLLDLLFEHYAPEDPDAETPLQWAKGKCCGAEEAVRLLRPYFPDDADHTDS